MVSSNKQDKRCSVEHDFTIDRTRQNPKFLLPWQQGSVCRKLQGHR